jgi:hypothetical protein
MDSLYKFVPGPLFLIGAGFIFYEWMYGGIYWVLFGFIPITPLLILGLLGIGIFLIKKGYIDGDAEFIKKYLGDK